MPKRGLALPVGATPTGRAKVSGGDVQMAKLVALSMADGESTNPFNTDVGLAVRVFDVDSVGSRSLVRRGIERHFARWQADGRARLEAVQVQPATDGGDLHVLVRYTDLETDEPRDVSNSSRKV